MDVLALVLRYGFLPIFAIEVFLIVRALVQLARDKARAAETEILANGNEE